MDEARSGAAVMMPKVVWVARKVGGDTNQDTALPPLDGSPKGSENISSRKGFLPLLKSILARHKAQPTTVRL